eukprot:TRINITY_DN12870_c0_g1_i4.p1 TRINITY_DN12870_c0_g1~~TRINITY_DN12870_c0_g1_i4.p1  ORF type:complete len:446 (-),score=69.06 TRINITY_DN12870_c0_g1_i4:53-1390(-)
MQQAPEPIEFLSTQPFLKELASAFLLRVITTGKAAEGRMPRLFLQLISDRAPFSLSDGHYFFEISEPDDAEDFQTLVQRRTPAGRLTRGAILLLREWTFEVAVTPGTHFVQLRVRVTDLAVPGGLHAAGILNDPSNISLEADFAGLLERARRRLVRGTVYATLNPVELFHTLQFGAIPDRIDTPDRQNLFSQVHPIMSPGRRPRVRTFGSEVVLMQPTANQPGELRQKKRFRRTVTLIDTTESVGGPEVIDLVSDLTKRRQPTRVRQPILAYKPQSKAPKRVITIDENGCVQRGRQDMEIIEISDEEDVRRRWEEESIYDAKATFEKTRRAPTSPERSASPVSVPETPLRVRQASPAQAAPLRSDTEQVQNCAENVEIVLAPDDELEIRRSLAELPPEQRRREKGRMTMHLTENINDFIRSFPAMKSMDPRAWRDFKTVGSQPDA